MSIISDKYKRQILLSLENADSYKSKITDEIIHMEGATGKKTRHFYNNLLSMDDSRYLEIGTFKGSSVCSAMCGNNALVYCIDHWNESYTGSLYIDEFFSNFEKYKGINEAHFIKNDCFAVDVSTLPKFNIYMYDGDHSYNSHFNALVHFINCLDDIFIYIVDDWNWEDVRNGTFKSIQHLNLKILYEKEIRLTNDNSHTPEREAKDTWWNGMYIVILQK
jgi:hypothetical protein